MLANFNIEEFGNVKRIYSQVNAMKQCERFISSELKQVEKVLTKSTASAAKLVKENGKNDEVAIASSFAAKEYGLFIIDEGIQDKSDNFTKFVLVSK